VISREALRPQGDLRLFLLGVGLALLGVAMIFSAGQVEVASLATGIWRRQLVWLVIALIAFIAVSRIPLRWLDWAAGWLYGAAIVLLVAVLFFGTGPNTRSWLYFGPFGLQPAEFAKLATILLLARTLSSYRGKIDRLSQLARPLAIVLLPIALVALQPDLGSALVFGAILIAGLYWAGVPIATLFMLVSPGISLLLGFSPVVWGIWFLAVAVFLYVQRPYLAEGMLVLLANVAAGALTLPFWRSLAPYQQNRLVVFLDPGVDPRGAGWHLIQSKVAIGSGGWFGQGFAQGPQKRLAFLPEQHTDFVFSVVGEELGFLGVSLMILLLAAFLQRVLTVARTTEDSFASITVFCLFAVWFSHVIINIGMTVGLMPITGLPLPFLSYGGSFLLSLFLGLAIVMRVSAES
jgi:rod shape determining protein RodA